MTSRAPVFVVGCPRSGTTLLYHMLLSAGGFVHYRAETHVYNRVAPRYGGLRHPALRRRFADEWLASEYFRRSGLDAERFRERILSECYGGGDLLRLFMEAMARQQGMNRWADCTPAHGLYLTRIRQDFPGARFLHVVRDGRDVALSLARREWIRPFPWDGPKGLVAPSLYWRWFVNRTLREEERLGDGCLKVRYEKLVEHPEESLDRVGRFIGHRLDYREILETGIGSVERPNTSFAEEGSRFDPVARWRRKMAEEDLRQVERLTGDLLARLRYPLSVSERKRPDVGARMVGSFYDSYFGLKHRLKQNRFLGWLFAARNLMTSGFEKTGSDRSKPDLPTGKELMGGEGTRVSNRNSPPADPPS